MQFMLKNVDQMTRIRGCFDSNRVRQQPRPPDTSENKEFDHRNAKNINKLLLETI